MISSIPKMHVDELDIDEELVHRLLVKQFPRWADLPLSRVEPAGTVNAIFRLGDHLSIRLPRRRGATSPGSKELDWLPRLAPQLPLEIPVAVAEGSPMDEYPWYWEIHTWVEGESVAIEDIDPIQAARDLASFVKALRAVDPVNAPAGRGIHLRRAMPSARPCRQTMQHGTGLVGGRCPKLSQPLPTTPQRTTRPCIARRRCG